MATRTTRTRILSTLGRGPQRGLTAETISARAGVALGTTRTTLSTLQLERLVTVVGTASTSGRGRPANLYRTAS